MADNDGACIPTIDPLRKAQLLEARGLGHDVDLGPVVAGGAAQSNGFIALIESRALVRECIRRSMQSALSLPIVTYSTASDLEPQLRGPSAELVVLSLADVDKASIANMLSLLSDLVPKRAVIVLAQRDDVDLALTAMRHGAKAFIPSTMDFAIAVEAVRVVLAGGTYVPMECLFAAGHPSRPTPPIPLSSGVVTRRELAVVRAIQQGKSNKIIAYELNMCESTVKVHVRNIMKKLKAKNRTDIAIKLQPAFAPAAEGIRGNMAASAAA
jgi:DNA-binding NarL/FixJ family response regulator